MKGISLLTVGTALGCGLIAGAFFAFSTFVMKALSRLPPAHGIAAMQSINVTVINPWFMGAFLGTAAAGAVLAVSSILAWHEPGAGLRLAGSLLYIFGTVAVTMVFNVPRNDALAKALPDSVEAAALWSRYLVGWTAWNHVRTIAALVAAALLMLALLVPGRPPGG